jgi:uncharacterized protein (DUF427 family)
MVKATWNKTVIAQSAETEIVEGNHYFPPDSVKEELLRKSDRHSTCPWKGVASYYDIVIDEKVNRDAAWYYPDPKEAARQIAGYIAFWNGVEVQES